MSGLGIGWGASSSGNAPAVPVWQIGFGSPFFTDAGKTAPATADGDLVYTAADSIGSGDLTQSASGNRPILDLFTFNGVPALQFRMWRGDYLGGSAMPLDARNFTLCMLMTTISNASANGAIYSYFAGDTTTGRVQVTPILPLSNESVFWTGVADNYGANTIGYGASIVTVTGTATSFTVRVNGVDLIVSTPADAGHFGFGTLGTLAGNYPTHTAFAGIKGYNRALTHAEVVAWESYAAGYASIGTTFDSSRAAFTVIGDSLSTGYTISDAVSWPVQMFGLLANGATYQRSCANMAQPGSTTTQWLTAASVRVDPYYDARRPGNVCFVWIGTNGGTVDEVKSLCSDRKAAGWTVVAVDKLPRGDGSSESLRVAFNASLAGDFPTSPSTNIRAGATYADYLIQLSGDPAIGQAGDQDDATYYLGDQTHMTAAGYAVVATYAMSVMNLMGYT